MRHHLLAEPHLPAFVVRMRRTLDAAAARHSSDVAVHHSYFGHEREDRRIAVHGWTSRLVRIRGRNALPIDVYFDAFDDDVMLLGGAEYREWFPDDESTEQECLDDLDRVVESLAADTLRTEEDRRLRSLAAIGGSAALIGVAIGRSLRRR